MDEEEKRKKVRLVVGVLMGLNLVLFFIKWTPTVFFPSLSIKADSFNSLGDFAYSGLLLLGFELLYRPSDETHPHGHERFEPFISLIIAGAIAFTGLLIVKQAVENLSGSTYRFTPFFVIALLFSMAAKYWLYSYLRKQGERLKSTALKASSKDAKIDVLSSLTAMGGVIAGWLGIPILDTLVGVVVSLWIFKTAYEIGRENVGFLTGRAAPREIVEEIKEILKERKEVIHYHDLVAHHVGPEIHVSLSIHLPDELNFREVHEIEEKLTEDICAIKRVDVVYLHLEPDRGE